MKEDIPFLVTEWEWLKLQLRLYAQESKGELFGIRFGFTDDPCHIHCKIFNSCFDQIFKETKDRDQIYEEYISGWVEMENEIILKIISTLPETSKTFNTKEDLIYEIMWDYGTGSSVVCTINGNKIDWNGNLIDDAR